jgi:glycosyltransferase involved in cell wall biosynthesis
MPKVSVILPVYNAEKYLKEAIDSILNQTYTDFELILINDGSTDGSQEIIDNYKDHRIVHISNEINKGLIYSLNKAIDFAKGKYIARMDADDIALPQRFEKQVEYLEKTNISILATKVKLIDENGETLHDWDDDAKNITAVQIKNFLLKDNCVAHPTIMGKTAVFKKYKYQYNQKYSEDYDLWLRITADGMAIEKISEPLLLHRILDTSATRFKKMNHYYRLAKVKFRFLWPQIKKGRFSLFNTKVFLFGLADMLKAGGKEIKALISK